MPEGAGLVSMLRIKVQARKVHALSHESMDTAEAQCNEDADDSSNYRARVARLSGDGLSDGRSHESRSHCCDPSLGNRICREMRDSGLASSGRDKPCNGSQSPGYDRTDRSQESVVHGCQEAQQSTNRHTILDLSKMSK